jgi:hypothetical protein
LGLIAPTACFWLSDLPALREGHLEGEIGVVERVAAEEPLARVLAEHDPVEPRHVLRAVDGFPPPAGEARHLGRDAPSAVRRRRMARQPVRQPAGLVLDLAHPSEHARTRRASGSGRSPRGHVPQAEVVRLPLGVAAVLQEQEAEAGLGQVAEVAQLGGQDHAGGEADRGELLAADHLHAEWRAVTWPISWPSTAASSASLLRWVMMPRVI